MLCSTDAGTAGSTITNTASVTNATEGDSNGGNNSDSADITVAAQEVPGGAASGPGATLSDVIALLEAQRAELDAQRALIEQEQERVAADVVALEELED